MRHLGIPTRGLFPGKSLSKILLSLQLGCLSSHVCGAADGGRWLEAEAEAKVE